MMKVFLSSTAKDLSTYREAVSRAILKLDGFELIRMEDFGARDSVADEYCRQKVAECDLFVGIVGFCYGSTPKDSRLSYSAQEYEAAVSAELPRLMFLSKEGHFYEGYYRESDELWKRQQEFRKRIVKERILDYFREPSQLAGIVATAISNWQRETAEIITEPDYFRDSFAQISSSKNPFDHQVVDEASLSDMDLDRIGRFFTAQRVQRQDDYVAELPMVGKLERMNLLVAGKPTSGALLSFGIDPARWVAGCATRCVVWKGLDRKTGWRDDHDFRGSILEQYENSLAFVLKSLRLGRQILEGRKERYDLPISAVQEALANALVHREYSGRNESVQVELFDDRLEIKSPGGLPDSISLELLGKVELSHPRNPQIARIFYLTRHIEKVGSGILRMQAAMEDYGLSPAQLELSPVETFKVTFQRRRLESESKIDPAPYLRILQSETAYIDIRGLQVGTGKATSIPIEELYVSLKTIVLHEPMASKTMGSLAHAKGSQRVELERTLAANPRLVVTGDPGAGKTTFMRWICQLACQGLLDGDSEAVQRLGFPEAPFPMLIRLSDFQDHRAAQKGQPGAPTVAPAPEWLLHFLACQWEEESGLDANFFRKKVQKGPALLLLDGLDEVSGERDRKLLVNWIEKATAYWGHCRIVVTSRPATYKGESVLSGFAHASIEDLEESAVETLLSHCCQAFFPTDPPRAERHHKELLHALRSRPEIRRMARNPVMLTALAVVHWNEKHLPEQRADLYESILTWLSRSREDLPHRPSPERSLMLLQALALVMQDHKKGRQVQVSRRWAAEAIAPEWRELPESERVAAAQTFLDQEEKDSGIVVRRGSEVRFWHLTFQEYLAARALAGLGDREQHQRLLKNLYGPEWKEVVLLLAGVLRSQGVERVDNLLAAVLDQLGDKPSLSDQARCARILGAILRDLVPMKYQVSDERYKNMLQKAMGIFGKARSVEIPIDVVIEVAEALGQAGDTRFEGDQLGHNWVEIPAGEVWIGAQSQNQAGNNFDSKVHLDESPVHAVELDAYSIGRYPVTVSEFERFVEDGCYGDRAYWQEGGIGEWMEPEIWAEQAQHPNRPVVGVSWFEAAAYAKWARAQLPTEAQWERAARGTEGRKYSWGNKEPSHELMNFAAGIGSPTPVGVYLLGCTPEGIADLAGNVLEWCRDWYGPYPSQLQKNPQGLANGRIRVLRGGAWNDRSLNCRASYRYYSHPTDRHLEFGFRVVRAYESASTEKGKT